MAAKKPGDRIGAMIGDVEELAQRMRADITKRAKAAGLPKNLQKVATQLRKRAATAAAQVEKYVHQLRKDLEGGARPAHRARSSKRKHAATA